MSGLWRFVCGVAAACLLSAAANAADVLVVSVKPYEKLLRNLCRLRRLL